MTAIEDARAATDALAHDLEYQHSDVLRSARRALVASRALIAEHERLTADRDYMVTNAEGLYRSGVRMQTEIERLTAPPTDDEREALAQVIFLAKYPGSADAWDRASDSDKSLWYRKADPILAAGFRRQGPITDEWEYKPGYIEADGRVFAQSGVIAPGYVQQFMAEGGDVIRRRVGKFETVEAARNA